MSTNFKPTNFKQPSPMDHVEDRHVLYGHTNAIDYLNQKPLLASVFIGTAVEPNGKIIIASLKVRYIEFFLDQEFADFIKNYSTDHNSCNIQLDHEHSLNFRFWECAKEDDFASKLQEIRTKKQIKIVAVDVCEMNEEKQRPICEQLWLEEDIVCFTKGDQSSPCTNKGDAIKRARCYAIQLARRYFKEDFFYDVLKVDYCEKTRIIRPKFLTSLETYEKFASKEVIDGIKDQAAKFKQTGSKILFISSTMQGGGVALMRHALIRLMSLLGVNAKWMVLFPDSKVFEITKKKFHNILQGILPESIVLHEEDKHIYLEWIASNYDRLKSTILDADVIVIDDYQPSGLIPLIKKDKPEIKIVYRSHIQIRADLVENHGSSQRISWDFIWKDNKVCDADAFVSHPIPEFVPSMVPQEKVYFMPATTDPLDGLNKPLSKTQLEYYMHVFNLSLIMDNQKPLDLDRPYMCQIARFDPSKGIVDVLHAFRQVRKIYKHLRSDHSPQLVLCGHGAIDDPEGLPVLEVIKTVIDMGIFKDIADDIKILRLPHNDQVLAAVIQSAYCCVQLSHREGLEVKVTEALHHGKPVVITNSGGMKLQVREKENSYIVQMGDAKKVGDLVFGLLADQDLYSELCAKAKDGVKKEFFTMSNCYNWLRIANELLDGKTGNGSSLKSGSD